MNPSSSPTPGYDPSIKYCTASPLNAAVRGGQVVIGQDILEGLFMVYDFDKQRVGFANSSANNDRDFYIPPATGTNPGTPTPPASSSCTYVDTAAIDAVVVTPTITSCTGANFGGTCYESTLNESGCALIDK